MKNLLLLSYLLLSIASAQAQGRLELKANVLPIAILSRAELSGEYLLSSRIGIEAGVGYEWENLSLSEPFMMNNGAREIRKSRLMNYYLSGKYYFFPKNGGDRLFTGILLHHQYYLSRTINGQAAEKPDPVTSFGIEPGYKWTIKKRFVAETGIRWLISWSEVSLGGKIFDLDMVINGKIGYRF